MDGANAGRGPETVVVLGLSHGGGFQGVALMDGDAISTPLGEALLDVEAGNMLADHSARIHFDYAPHRGEHSAENEIPFLQAALPDAKIVAGLLGDHDKHTMDDLVSVLEALAKRKSILVVASTDLLHDPDYDLVTRTDKETLEQMAETDYEGILKRWSGSTQVCCGVGPVTAVMRFAESQGCRRGEVLHYRNSGDDFPESRGSWVVGYGAVVFALPEQ